MFFCKQAFCIQKYIVPKGQHRVKSLKKKNKYPKFIYSITAVRQLQASCLLLFQMEFKPFK